MKWHLNEVTLGCRGSQCSYRMSHTVWAIPGHHLKPFSQIIQNDSFSIDSHLTLGQPITAKILTAECNLPWPDERENFFLSIVVLEFMSGPFSKTRWVDRKHNQSNWCSNIQAWIFRLKIWYFHNPWIWISNKEGGFLNFTKQICNNDSNCPLHIDYELNLDKSIWESVMVSIFR